MKLTKLQLITCCQYTDILIYKVIRIMKITVNKADEDNNSFIYTTTKYYYYYILLNYYYHMSKTGYTFPQTRL